MIKLDVNAQLHELDIDATTPLLWVLREQLGLTGTKYACGVGLCGNCTVLVDGHARLSCRTSVAELQHKKIVTIEGISSDQGLHPVQQAWLDENVAECGYCQSGQILTAISLLQQHPHPDDSTIDSVMSQVLCRCGTYARIRKAIKRAAERQAGVL